jgi:CMP-N-acetylneuraminic acid synthetase
MVSSFVVVPARGGSKGIKNKNLISIKEKSLTVRSIVHATTITEEQNIILSTDSKEIVENVAELQVHY